MSVISLRRLRRVSFLLIFLVTAPFGPSRADSLDIVDDDLARMKRGEVLLQTIHSEKSGGAARVAALFYGDTEEIWRIIGHCEYGFIYVHGLKYCEVLEAAEFYTKVRQKVRSSWYTPTMDFTYEANRSSPKHGEFKLVGGDLKVMEGQWNLVPAPDREGIIVVHEIRVRSWIPAPRWLVRRVLKGDLPDMLACMRGLAEASGDSERIHEDLARCPGDRPESIK